MINKLRRRFILITMVSVTLVMALLGVAINLMAYFSTDNDLKHMLFMLANNKGDMPAFQNGRPAKSFDNLLPKEISFTPETPFATRYFVLFYNKSGELLNADMKHIAAVTQDDADEYIQAAQKSNSDFGYYNGYKFYVKPVNSNETMAVFLDCRREFDGLKKYALITAAVMLSGICLVFILVFFLSKKSAQNAIKNEEKQKRFITDAGHELKTPLTVIATALKVLELETGQNKWIDKIKNQTDKLGELTQDLVALARLDEKKPALQPSEFNISDAVSQTAESFEQSAQAAGLSIISDISQGIMYVGDEYAIRRLVTILMDNAIKYSEAGGQITVGLIKEKNAVILSVQNPCADIESDELNHVFDRFYRMEKSRSRQTGGFGIGLSIAKSTAEAHKGTIKASFSDGIIKFTVILPSVSRILN